MFSSRAAHPGNGAHPTRAWRKAGDRKIAYLAESSVQTHSKDLRGDGGPIFTAKILPHRRRPVPMADLGPGLRREDEEGRIAMDHPNASEHCSRAAPPEGGAAVPGYSAAARVGVCAAARIAAASLATRVPSKKCGFCVPHSLTALAKVKSRKLSAVMWPSSTSS